MDWRAGKMPTTLVRSLVSLFSRSWGLLDQICRPFALGEPGEGQDLGAGLVQVFSGGVEAQVGEVADHAAVLSADGFGVGLGEDGSDHDGPSSLLWLVGPWSVGCAGSGCGTAATTPAGEWLLLRLVGRGGRLR